MSDDVIDLTLSSDHEEDVDDVSLTQLHVAISTVPEARLRQIVAKLVDSDIAVRRAMLKELVMVKKQTRVVVPRYETCVSCREVFDANEDREEDECCYHPGTLKVDYTMFVDWDEGCHGPMDTRSNRREYPENFKWSCCNKNGITDGCRQREHTSQNKKRRV